LSAKEWNNLIYKHIDHHLKQFGVWKKIGENRWKPFLH
jgi:hypothetical protein